MKNFTIIAGPCSIDEKNIEEAIEIGNIPEVDGVRCVGLKSVTSPRPFMGIDKDWFFNEQLSAPPSLEYARRIVRETKKFVALEMMDVVQLFFMKSAPELIGKAFIWNPAINQLGWPMYRAAKVAAKYGWQIGLKNAKWSGDPEFDVAALELSGVKINPVRLDNGEKAWYGCAKFVEEAGVVPTMIARGTEGRDKGDFRNIPNHDSAEKMFMLGYNVFFDPSHTFGSGLREQIVERTLDALNLKTAAGAFIYSGILIEVGTAQTDTGQHISIIELRNLIEGIRLQRGI